MNKLKLITAGFCAPCKVLKAELEAQNLEVETVIAEDNQELVKSYGVRSVPTLVVDNGAEIELVSGSDQIINVIKNNK